MCAFKTSFPYIPTYVFIYNIHISTSPVYTTIKKDVFTCERKKLCVRVNINFYLLLWSTHFRFTFRRGVNLSTKGMCSANFPIQLVCAFVRGSYMIHVNIKWRWCMDDDDDAVATHHEKCWKKCQRPQMPLGPTISFNARDARMNGLSHMFLKLPQIYCYMSPNTNRPSFIGL